LSYLFNWGLFGVLTVQVYIYYIAFPRDDYRRKSVVSLAYVLEIVQVGLSTRDVYRAYAIGWGNAAALDDIGLLWFSVPILTGFISCLSQLFYAWRISALSHNPWVVSAISVLSVTQASLSMWDGVECKRVGRFTLFTHTSVFRAKILASSGSALTDVAITCCMFYYLRKAKNASMITRTTTMLTRLIRLTIESGLITAAVASVNVILFAASQDTLMYTIPLVVTTKIYSNCLLALLNSRIQVVGGRNTIKSEGMIDSFDVSTSSQPMSSKGFLRTPQESHGGVAIEITQISDAHQYDSKGYTNSIPDAPIELTKIHLNDG